MLLKLNKLRFLGELKKLKKLSLAWLAKKLKTNVQALVFEVFRLSLGPTGRFFEQSESEELL